MGMPENIIFNAAERLAKNTRHFPVNSDQTCQSSLALFMAESFETKKLYQDKSSVGGRQICDGVPSTRSIILDMTACPTTGFIILVITYLIPIFYD